MRLPSEQVRVGIEKVRELTHAAGILGQGLLENQRRLESLLEEANDPSCTDGAAREHIDAVLLDLQEERDMLLSRLNNAYAPQEHALSEASSAPFAFNASLELDQLRREKADALHQAELARMRIADLETKHDAFKQENWDLFVSQQRLEEQIASRTAAQNRAESERHRITNELDKMREAFEAQATQLEQQDEAVRRLAKQRDTEQALSRRERAGFQRNVSDLQGQLKRTEHQSEQRTMKRTPSSLASPTSTLRPATPMLRRSKALDDTDSSADEVQMPNVHGTEVEELHRKLAIAVKRLGRDSQQQRKLRDQLSELRKMVGMPAEESDESDKDEAWMTEAIHDQPRPLRRVGQARIPSRTVSSAQARDESWAEDADESVIMKDVPLDPSMADMLGEGLTRRVPSGSVHIGALGAELDAQGFTFKPGMVDVGVMTDAAELIARKEHVFFVDQLKQAHAFALETAEAERAALAEALTAKDAQYTHARDDQQQVHADALAKLQARLDAKAKEHASALEKATAAKDAASGEHEKRVEMLRAELIEYKDMLGALEIKHKAATDAEKKHLAALAEHGRTADELNVALEKRQEEVATLVQAHESAKATLEKVRVESNAALDKLRAELEHRVAEKANVVFEHKAAIDAHAEKVESVCAELAWYKTKKVDAEVQHKSTLEEHANAMAELRATLEEEHKNELGLLQSDAAVQHKSTLEEHANAMAELRATLEEEHKNKLEELTSRAATQTKQLQSDAEVQHKSTLEEHANAMAELRATLEEEHKNELGLLQSDAEVQHKSTLEEHVNAMAELRATLEEEHKNKLEELTSRAAAQTKQLQSDAEVQHKSTLEEHANAMAELRATLEEEHKNELEELTSRAAAQTKQLQLDAEVQHKDDFEKHTAAVAALKQEHESNIEELTTRLVSQSNRLQGETEQKYKSALEEQSKAIGALRAELDKEQACVAKAEQACQFKDTEMNSLRAALEKARIADSDTAQAHQFALDAKAAELRAALEAMQSKHDEETARLRAELEQNTLEHDALRSRHEQSYVQHAASTAMHEAAAAKASNTIETLHKEQHDRDATISRLEKALAEQTSVANELRSGQEASAAQLRAQLDQKQSVIAELETMFQEKDAEHAQASALLRTDLDTYREAQASEMAALQAQLVALQHKLEAETQAVAALDAQLRIQQAQAASEKDHFALLQAELRKQLAIKEDQVNALESMRRSASEAHAMSSATLEKDAAAAQAALEQLPALRADRDRLSRSVADLHRNLDETQSELRALRSAQVKQSPSTPKARDESLPATHRRNKSVLSTLTSETSLDDAAHPEEIPAWVGRPAAAPALPSYLRGVEPEVADAIMECMIGEWMYKYARRSLLGGAERRHARYFFINPYNRTVHWTERDPTTRAGTEAKSKTAHIEEVALMDDNNQHPPGLYSQTIVIRTGRREMKLTAPSKARHRVWVTALGSLLQRPDPSIAGGYGHARVALPLDLDTRSSSRISTPAPPQSPVHAGMSGSRITALQASSPRTVRSSRRTGPMPRAASALGNVTDDPDTTPRAAPMLTPEIPILGSPVKHKQARRVAVQGSLPPTASPSVVYASVPMGQATPRASSRAGLSLLRG